MNGKHICYMISLLIASLFWGCSPEDLVTSSEQVYIDTTYTNDTIIKTDTIINGIDTFIKKDTIIQRDTIIDSHTFSYTAEIYANIPDLGRCQGKSFQGFAAYKDIAFGFYDTGLCRCIDLNKKEIISEFELPQEAHNSKNHAGVACFSEEFLTSEDEFPLLYLSSYKEYKCYVLRMFRDHSEIAQILYTNNEPNSSGKISLAPIVGYEPDRDKLLLKIKKSNNLYRWITVYRPSVSFGETYYIDLKNKIDTYDATSTSAYNAGFVENGKIYQLAGYTQSERKLYILDYINKTTLVDEYWNHGILNDGEQEQCTRFKEGILINYNHRGKLVYVKFNNWTF